MLLGRLVWGNCRMGPSQGSMRQWLRFRFRPLNPREAGTAYFPGVAVPTMALRARASFAPVLHVA